MRDSQLAAQAFSRAAGAPLIGGNRVRVLRGAAENYPAWFGAIASARSHVFLETYLLHEDAVGRELADLLAGKARDGVAVFVLYDWLGSLGHTSSRFWQTLRRAGVQVRAFNPPQVASPFGWLSRDHRKVLTADGRIGFVSGLCIGSPWVGDPARGREPWRDTGVEVLGPAVPDIENAFASAWAMAGDALPAGLGRVPRPDAAGPVSLRVIAGEPQQGTLYRLDKLVAAMARRTLYLTDAYFVGGTSYIQSLVAAARDGVDVRLLVPGASDLPVVRSLSRAAYRPLLEGGVRVFEWNGSMLHAKTAVADGQWARVGSTNLNPASWIGNYELDVAIENPAIGGGLSAMFLDDLTHSTEIVLQRRRQVRLSATPERRRRRRGRRGRTLRALAGVAGVGNTIGAAIMKRRELGEADARVLGGAAAAIALFAALIVAFPLVLAVPVAVVGAWLAIGLAVRAARLLRSRRPSAVT